MIHDWKMEIYWRLPVFLQETALTFYAGYLDRLYYGGDYERCRSEYQQWQRRSLADAQAWQNKKLQLILKLAGTRVPYYRDQWQSVPWQAVSSMAELHRLPTVDKQSIRENPKNFIVEGLDTKSLWMEKTSGTTGTALRIYWPKSMLPKWWAITEVMVRNVAGVEQHMPRATISGRPIVRGDTKQPPYWRFNRRWRQLYLSGYHISRDTARSYIEAIRHYGSQWVTGYGSAIAALAESALAEGIPPLRLRAVVVSGDTLLPGMRSSIEEFFQCKCFDSYGQCEGVSTAMECVYGRLHLIPMVGVLEIVREDHVPCLPGEVGELVATSLLNDAMPLVRYRLGDYAAWATDQNCRCGNTQPIIEDLQGRIDDYVITTAGNKIGRLAGFRRSTNIHSAQLVQIAPDHAFLLVRPGRCYTQEDALAVRNDIRSRVGEMRIDVVEVAEVPKTPQGKTVSVVRLKERPEMLETYEKLLGRSRTVQAESPL